MGQGASTPTANALQSCLRTAVGQNVAFAANNPLYQLTDVKRYNLDIDSNPFAITYPSSNEQVAAVITCARDNKAKVQARSGGHSYANFALGGAGEGSRNTVVVDLEKFRGFSMDEESWVATIGAGTLLGDVTEKLAGFGRAMAHGTCPQVGIGGHATIGGLGPMSRMWGAALDHVREVDVVLANSSIVTASPTSHADIFWALKGAGASFGVITSFKMTTHAPPSETVQYTYTFTQKPFTALGDRFKLWLKMCSDPALDRKLASQLIFSEVGAILQGTYFGTRAEFDALNLTSVFPAATTESVTVFDDWMGQVANWGEDLALTIGGGISSAFYSKSLAYTADDILPDATVDAVLQYLDDVDKGTPVWFLIFDLEGGAINDVPKDGTAYGHRDALYYSQSYAVNMLKMSEKSRDFVRGINEVITTGMQGHSMGAYAGYVDMELPDAQREYWGDNYPRLQRIKKVVDPLDIFHNPQSVRLP